MISNTHNDMKYIGVTSVALHTRLKQHTKPSTLKRKQGNKFSEAIKCLGVDSFYIEPLETNISKENAFEREIFWINKYDSYRNGYNSTNGGNSRCISSDRDVERLKEMKDSRYSLDEIANELNVHKFTITRTLHGLGLSYYNSVPKEYLFENKDVKTNIQMANELKVSPATISRAFKKYKIPRGKGCSNHLNPQNNVGFIKGESKPTQ